MLGPHCNLPSSSNNQKIWQSVKFKRPFKKSCQAKSQKREQAGMYMNSVLEQCLLSVLSRDWINCMISSPLKQGWELKGSLIKNGQKITALKRGLQGREKMYVF